MQHDNIITNLINTIDPTKCYCLWCNSWVDENDFIMLHSSNSPHTINVRCNNCWDVFIQKNFKEKQNR